MKTFIKWALIAVIGCFFVLLGFSIYLLIKEPSGANICAAASILLGFLLSLVLEVQQRLINRYHNESLDYLGDETKDLRVEYLHFAEFYCLMDNGLFKKIIKDELEKTDIQKRIIEKLEKLEKLKIPEKLDEQE